MGLDISFNKAAAEAAGIRFYMKRNGTDEQIAAYAGYRGIEERDYYYWLLEEEEVMELPCGIKTYATTFDNGTVVVRANPWGRIYGPLISLLDANDIQRYEHC